MARTSKNASSRSERVRALPWAALLQGVVIVGRRWQKLSSKDRERIKELLAESGGRVNRLSSKQRKELRKLAGKLDLKGMGKELMALRALRGRRRRRGA
jgi:hypothetical protein